MTTMSNPPQPPIPTVTPPRGRGPVLGCLSLVAILGLLLVFWLSGWLERQRSGNLAQRAHSHHVRRVAEDRLRRTVPPAGGAPERTVTRESLLTGEVLTRRAQELFAEGNWTSVIQCIGLLDDLPANDPELDLMLETALFNHALQQLREGRAIPALAALQRLLVLKPTDREAGDLRSVGRTIRDYGPDAQTAEALAQFNERR